MWIVYCTVLRLTVSYACIVLILRIISHYCPINQIIITLNGTLPFSATLNGKGKFVGHVEQLRSLLLLSVHNFICANCQPTPLALSLSCSLSFSPCKHTNACLLLKWPSEEALAMCLCNSCDLCPGGSHLSMDRTRLWMSVPSCARCHPSPEKQSWQQAWVQLQLLTRPLKSNVKHNFICSIDFEDENRLKYNSMRGEFKPRSNHRNENYLMPFHLK